jgi:hypothetical protein
VCDCGLCDCLCDCGLCVIAVFVCDFGLCVIAVVCVIYIYMRI